MTRPGSTPRPSSKRLERMFASAALGLFAWLTVGASFHHHEPGEHHRHDTSCLICDWSARQITEPSSAPDIPEPTSAVYLLGDAESASPASRLHARPAAPRGPPSIFVQ